MYWSRIWPLAPLYSILPLFVRQMMFPPPPESPPMQTVPSDTSSVLELRISSVFVRLYPEAAQTLENDAAVDAAMTPGSEAPSTPSICLLQGPLAEFVKYSHREKSQWLIDIAHDICDPEHKRGWLVVWNKLQGEWSHVTSTDSLIASAYRYDLPDGTTVGLSKIIQRENKSKTAATGAPRTMRAHVLERDGVCWVTRIADVVNSHICPKRMGDHNGRYIFRTFNGNPSIALDVASLSIYNEVFGLCLSHFLDSMFDVYHLGFRFVSTNNYECHVFHDIPGFTTTIFGGMSPPSAQFFSALHGHPASPPNPQSRLNPPPGLFRWHYLQCVIKKFGHDDYKSQQNVAFQVQYLPIKGDSDDEDSTDSEVDWPTKAFDLGRAAADDLREREERHRAVATWAQMI